MSEPISTIGVQLSAYEVWSLLRMMRLSGIPGIGLSALESVPDEFARNVDELALSSLRARGLVTIRGDTGTPVLVIDKTLGALLGASALCERCLTVSVSGEDGIESLSHVYFGSHLSVIHNLMQGDIHLFSAVTSGDVLLSALIAGLALSIDSELRLPAVSVIVDSDLLTNVYELSPDEAVNHLLAAGISSDAAHRIAAARGGTIRRASLQDMHMGTITGLQILTDNHDYFVVIPEIDGIHMDSANTSQVLDAVLRLIR